MSHQGRYWHAPTAFAVAVTLTAVGAVVLAVAAVAPAKEPAAPAGVTTYEGMCDASAAVAVGPDWFLVANDEDNVLCHYLREPGGKPRSEFDLTKFLALETKNPEADIEGAALTYVPSGPRVYWITSHGASRKGEPRPNRRRFFATGISRNTGGVTIEPAGKPYNNLLDDMAADERLERFKLDDAAKRAPESEGGLNIEGLADVPEAHALLIAFRNPIPDGKALVVPLLNPADLVERDGTRAKFGDPVLLPLGGRGVRSIDYHPTRKTYLIIAGAHNDDKNFVLFEWSGNAADAPKELAAGKMDGLNPEALFVAMGPEQANGTGVPPQVQILSDDGGEPVGNVDCKDAPPEQRSFRGAWFIP
jgi:hypothetical protein